MRQGLPTGLLACVVGPGASGRDITSVLVRRCQQWVWVWMCRQAGRQVAAWGVHANANSKRGCGVSGREITAVLVTGWQAGRQAAASGQHKQQNKKTVARLRIEPVSSCSAPARNRTTDPSITSAVLVPLSYKGPIDQACHPPDPRALCQH